LAPCAAACSHADYLQHVKAARSFLEGKDPSPLEALERDMAAASAALAFERAAVLRDKLEALRWLSGHLERLREASCHSAVYPVTGHDGREGWYLIHRGRVRAALAAPQDPGAGQAAARLLEAVYREAEPGAPALDEIDEILLVAGWFRRHRSERERTLMPEQAQAACRG
jgi:excinuclease ABC subunit C